MIHKLKEDLFAQSTVTGGRIIIKKGTTVYPQGDHYVDPVTKFRFSKKSVEEGSLFYHEDGISVEIPMEKSVNFIDPQEFKARTKVNYPDQSKDPDEIIEQAIRDEDEGDHE